MFISESNQRTLRENQLKIRMAHKTKTQWHPAFCSAMKLELAEDKKYLEYTNEYNLTKKPLQIDLLIIKKISNHHVKNQIGKIFRGHNLIEYKSSEDQLNLDTFIKVIGYACLYKASERRVGEIKLEDITITLIRESYPRKLFKWFKKRGFKVEERYKGIFYVTRFEEFQIQILVAGKLSKENQKWLTLLNQKLGKEDAERAVSQSNRLTQKDEKELADSVLQVAISENEEVFYGVKKEEDGMCEALRKLMEPEINEMKAAAIAEGLATGIAEGRAEGRAEAEAELNGVIQAMSLEIEELKKQISVLLQKADAV